MHHHESIPAGVNALRGGIEEAHRNAFPGRPVPPDALNALRLVGEAAESARDVQGAILAAYCRAFPTWAWTDWRAALDRLAEYAAQGAGTDPMGREEVEELERQVERLEYRAQELENTEAENTEAENAVEEIRELRDRALDAVRELRDNLADLELKLADPKAEPAAAPEG